MLKRPFDLSLGSFFFILLSMLNAQVLSGQDDLEDLRQLPRNQIIELKTEHSDYHLFIPKRQPERILVIAHGTPNAGQSTTELSKLFIQRWTEFGASKRLLLIFVSFNRENFASDSRKVGYGYRGLFGRAIGADEYVIQLVEPPKTAIMRTWRSKSGTYRVDAKLVEYNGSEIKLVTESGDEIEVEKTALSKSDINFLEQ